MASSSLLVGLPSIQRRETTPQPFDTDESPHLNRPFIIHLEIIPRNPVQLIHPSMHKYIYNRPLCLGFQNQFWAVIKKGTQQCRGGSLIFLITAGSGYFNSQNQRTAGSEYFKTSLGFMTELANTQQQLSRQLFDFFKKKLSIIECQFTLKSSPCSACPLFRG
jgi:hypothetical protein